MVEAGTRQVDPVKVRPHAVRRPRRLQTAATAGAFRALQRPPAALGRFEELDRRTRAVALEHRVQIGKRIMRVDIATHMLLPSGCGWTEKAKSEESKEAPATTSVSSQESDGLESEEPKPGEQAARSIKPMVNNCRNDGRALIDDSSAIQGLAQEARMHV